MACGTAARCTVKSTCSVLLVRFQLRENELFYFKLVSLNVTQFYYIKKCNVATTVTFNFLS